MPGLPLSTDMRAVQDHLVDNSYPWPNAFVVAEPLTLHERQVPALPPMEPNRAGLPVRLVLGFWPGCNAARPEVPRTAGRHDARRDGMESSVCTGGTWGCGLLTTPFHSGVARIAALHGQCPPSRSEPNGGRRFVPQQCGTGLRCFDCGTEAPLEFRRTYIRAWDSVRAIR